jgi:short-subunit dehydrogenase
MSVWTEGTIVIAGGTGELGRHLVDALAGKASLLIVGRDRQKFLSLAECYPGLEFQSIEEYQGEGLVFINAIGAPSYFKADDFSQEEARRSYESNFEVPAKLISAALHKMHKAKKGWIININSLSGLQGYPYGGGYVPFKFALRGFLETARKERGKADIRISEIYAGIIDTPFSSALPFTFDREEAISPVQIASLVAWMICRDFYLSHVEWPNDRFRVMRP